MGRILLIEDHSLVRGGYERLIQTVPHLEVVAEAASLEEALPKLASSRPSVVTLDLMLPGISGAEAVDLLFQVDPKLAILVVSSRTNGTEIQELLQHGVMGYITKDATSECFLEALEKVSKGEMYLSSEAAACLARRFREKSDEGSVNLSKRLKEVLVLISKGQKTKEIAETLFLSPRTVEKYRGQILRKLEVRNQIEALEKARRLGILQEENTGSAY